MRAYFCRVELNNNGEVEYRNACYVETEQNSGRMNAHRVYGYGWDFNAAFRAASAFLVSERTEESC